MDRNGFAWISLQFDDWVGFGLFGQMLVVSAGLKTIRILTFVVDLGRFYTMSTIWQIGVSSDRFGNIRWIWWWIWLNEFDWIRLIFYGFELFGWVWADFSRFAWICVDLGWLERIAVDLEDRYKFVFVGFGRVRWIHVDMATYLDGSGKIWMSLTCFDWILADFVGFGWIWVQIRADF